MFSREYLNDSKIFNSEACMLIGVCACGSVLKSKELYKESKEKKWNECVCVCLF